MPVFNEFYFESNTGKNTLYALRCTPDGEARGVVQIAHGIADHIDRYRDFMLFLAENGFVVTGNDHLGHGKSIQGIDEQGFFADENGWDYVVADMDKLHDMTSADFPGLPYVMFGHSMGSFLTRTYVIKHPDKYDAVILSGTGHQTKAMVDAGYAMSSAAVKLYGPRKLGVMLNDIAFGAYNKGYDNVRTEFDWVCSDPESVDKYIADPFCGFVARVSVYRDMMGGIKFITDPRNIEKMDKSKPVYLFSGACDPVGENGAGVTRAYNAFCKAGLRDVFMRLYPGGRHEMLNETNKQDVYNDVLNWLNEKI